MSENEAPNVLSVDEVARRTGEHPETIRRKIRAHEIFAVKVGEGPRAPWGVTEPDVDRYIASRDHARRMRESGVIVGRGDEFRERVAASDHPPATKSALLVAVDRRELFDRAEREMHADPTVRRRFEQLDADARLEAEARELAARIRHAEQVRRRALAILEDETED